MAKIILNPIGGLANRMRSIASGISLAQKCEVDYTIIWYKNWELNATFEDIFDHNHLVSNHVVYPSALKYNLFYSVPRKKNFYVSELAQMHYGAVLTDFSNEFYNLIKGKDSDENILDIVCATLKGGKDCYIQSGCNFYTCSKELYQNLFVANKSIKADVDRVLETMGETPIGIHIRRTDNKQSILHSPDNLFINEIRERLSSFPGQHFYLATDDEATKKKFIQLFDPAIRVSYEKANRNSRSGIIHAATEMMVLSRMSEILGSHYSSFSEVAALMGNIPLKQMYV